MDNSLVNGHWVVIRFEDHEQLFVIDSLNRLSEATVCGHFDIQIDCLRPDRSTLPPDVVVNTSRVVDGCFTVLPTYPYILIPDLSRSRTVTRDDDPILIPHSSEKKKSGSSNWFLDLLTSFCGGIPPDDAEDTAEPQAYDEDIIDHHAYYAPEGNIHYGDGFIDTTIHSDDETK
eukprot:TRINITY_DN21148_c0_g1::TRINITY_DN21148_c0_g1_i1::g.30127::m.30127 TRINITY_DN21148_c0_g1::TRINITY_DN21148_c0_g1_i1::g.30127  ORF type:complete len:174 (+),score=14.40 TRINITY_DN21148_c0_g1_i1:114-635(+)